MRFDDFRDFEQKRAEFTGVKYRNASTVTDLEQWLLPDDGRGLSHADYDYQPFSFSSQPFGPHRTIEPCVRI